MTGASATSDSANVIEMQPNWSIFGLTSAGHERAFFP